MKLLFLFSLLPAFLTGTHSTTETVNITVDFHEELASIDDVLNALNGDVSFDEEAGTYTYTITEQEIILNLEHGYSHVNGQKEPLYINIDEETGLKTITWTQPQLIEEEMFVPIQFIERIFDATATEDGFELTIVAEEEEIEEEDFEDEIEEEEIITSSNVIQFNKKDEVINQVSTKPTETTTSKPNYVQNPTQPSTSTSKPTESSPAPTPVTPPTPEPEPTPEVKPDPTPEVKPDPTPTPEPDPVIPPKEEEVEEVQPPVNDEPVLPEEPDTEDINEETIEIQ